MSTTAGTGDVDERVARRTGFSRALEYGDRTRFDNPRLEWRRLSSEMLGTFFLVLVATGGGLLPGLGQISLTEAVVEPGLMVVAIIPFMGARNPAPTGDADDKYPYDGRATTPTNRRWTATDEPVAVGLSLKGGCGPAQGPP
jgi:hypothetical protein